VQLQKRVAALEVKNNEEKDWSKFRAWCRDTLFKSSDYKALLSAFQEKEKEVGDILGKYKP
jgi:hypothetical protein